MLFVSFPPSLPKLDCTYSHFEYSSSCPTCRNQLGENDFTELVVADNYEALANENTRLKQQQTSLRLQYEQNHGDGVAAGASQQQRKDETTVSTIMMSGNNSDEDEEEGLSTRKNNDGLLGRRITSSINFRMLMVHVSVVKVVVHVRQQTWQVGTQNHPFVGSWMRTRRWV